MSEEQNPDTYQDREMHRHAALEAINAAYPLITVHPVMPPEIAKAIVTVMAQIKPLEKDETNKFAHYKYVSVDQFFEEVGRKMAGAGIFILAFEGSLEIARRSSSDDQGKTKESMWLAASYDLYIYHETGASFGPIRRTIQVPASGAQAYASALSFVEKYFLRGLFKIPTGDADADADPRRDLPAGRREPERNLDDERREIEEGQLAFVANSKREWEKITTTEGLKTWWDDRKAAMHDVFGNLSAGHYTALKDAFIARGKQLTPSTKPPIDFAAIRGAFESGLRLCMDEESCRAVNETYAAKYESGMTPDQIKEMAGVLAARIEKVRK